MKQPDETKKTAPDEPLPDAETEDVSGGSGKLYSPVDIEPPLFVLKIDPPYFGP